jgi:hypothetical protein
VTTQINLSASARRTSRFAPVCFVICATALVSVFLYGGNSQCPVANVLGPHGIDTVQHNLSDAQRENFDRLDTAIEKAKRLQQRYKPILLIDLLNLSLVDFQIRRYVTKSETLWVPSPPENYHQLRAR